MGASDIGPLTSLTRDCRLWVEDPGGFTTHRVGQFHHTYHLHPLFQLAEFEALAHELMPKKQVRFVRPGITQSSAFAHDSQHPDGRGIEEVFRRIQEPGSWVALYNIETVPRYKALLEDVLDQVRAVIDREQPGMFMVTGFVFISAPPSVTPFHIDRENNFWLMLRGRKVMNVWDRTDRVVVPADAVEDFIVDHQARKIRLKDGFVGRSHEFETRPGDGIYFPSTSPHMTRADVDPTGTEDPIAISVGVNFYTSVTRDRARVHQLNRVLRKCGITPADPGEAAGANRLKAPIGRAIGVTRNSIHQLAAPLLRGRKAHPPPPGSF